MELRFSLFFGISGSFWKLILIYFFPLVITMQMERWACCFIPPFDFKMIIFPYIAQDYSLVLKQILNI